MASGALTSYNPRPVSGFPAGSSAIVRAAWSPLRREPSHRSEMVNQVVLGELVWVDGSDAENWLKVRTADGYPGHVNVGAVMGVSSEDAAQWAALADGFSLGLRLEGSGALPVGRAPWGGRLPVAREGKTALPDGGSVALAAPSAGRLLSPAQRRKLYPADPGSVARTALTWMGSPYVWGGRIRSGTDCSGLVQSVFALHGIPLPRDSRQQADVGAGTGPDAGPGPESARPGDLLFFAWDGRPISHVGISLGGGEMVHSSETRGGVAIDRLGTGEFGRRLAAGFVGVVRPEG